MQMEILKAELERKNVENERLRGLLDEMNNKYHDLNVQLAKHKQNNQKAAQYQTSEEEHQQSVMIICYLMILFIVSNLDTYYLQY